MITTCMMGGGTTGVSVARGSRQLTSSLHVCGCLEAKFTARSGGEVAEAET